MFFIISIKEICFICKAICRHEDKISFLSEAKELVVSHRSRCRHLTILPTWNSLEIIIPVYMKWKNKCSDNNMFIHDKRSRALIVWLYAAAVLQVIHLHFSLYLASVSEPTWIRLRYRLEIFSDFINAVVDFSNKSATTLANRLCESMLKRERSKSGQNRRCVRTGMGLLIRWTKKFFREKYKNILNAPFMQANSNTAVCYKTMKWKYSFI